MPEMNQTEFQNFKEVVDAVISVVDPLLDGFQFTKDIGPLASALLGKVPPAVDGFNEVPAGINNLTHEQRTEIDVLVDSRITTIPKGDVYENIRPDVVQAVLSLTAIAIFLAVFRKQEKQ